MAAAITTDELATFHKQQATAVRMVTNSKIAAEVAAKRLQVQDIAQIAPSAVSNSERGVFFHDLARSMGDIVRAEKSQEVGKLQKQVESLEQRLFFAGPFNPTSADNTNVVKATSKSRKRTAAERDFDKGHAKMLKDGQMAFKKDAGEQMKGSIQCRGSRAVYFESKVDPEVFHNMFNSYEHFYKGSKEDSPIVYVVRLDHDELIAAFGKVGLYCADKNREEVQIRWRRVHQPDAHHI